MTFDVLESEKEPEAPPEPPIIPVVNITEPEPEPVEEEEPPKPIVEPPKVVEEVVEVDLDPFKFNPDEWRKIQELRRQNIYN